MVKGNDRIELWMTPTPYTIGADIPLITAKEVMRTKNVRHLPVLRRGELVGLLSEGVVSEALANPLGERFLVEDVMMPDVFTVSPDARLSEVADTMAREKCDSAVIRHPTSGSVIGIFTTVDACRALVDSVQEKAA